jgi:hypothetical protein
MGTSKSGYIQRRIIKLTEDMKVQYNGTVTDASGKIYQMAYGQDGIDPIHTVKVEENQEVCDISRIFNKLNMEHEIELEKKEKIKEKKVSKFKKDRSKA